MIDSSGASDGPIRLNPRTWWSVAAHAGLAAVLACWMVLSGFVPQAGWLWSLQGSDRLAWVIFTWASSFLVIWRVALGRTIEWTVTSGALRRRRWLSRPGRQPWTVATLGPGPEIVHETRYRWRVWPTGIEIYLWPWPGQTTRLIGAMERAGVRVDDFRGGWEREHRRLSTLALLAYGVAVAVLLATPAIGIALGSGLPVLPLVASVGAAVLGQEIDRSPWKSSKPSPQDG